MATNFLSRWSQRKLDVGSDKAEESVETNESAQVSEAESHVEKPHETPTDDAQNLSDGSDDQSVATLLASQVESSVKKAALRKLFLSGEFSEVDRLNDYDHDYQSVKSLSSEVASKLRDWVNDESEDKDMESHSSASDHEPSTEPADATLVADSQNVISAEGEDSTLDDGSEQVGQNIPHKQ